ncbi:unnamed protein product [Timema podura]|uniref:Cytochrome P450 family 4 n=1 Tax=Timema podura TaxID=61482 RepID=A0ABN7P1Y1_TIMPD|nr:unnamed protein product [Timema podura]
MILSSSVYINKSTEYKFFKPWLGEGLLISSGNKWRSHRKLIAPTFHLNVLKSFVDLFNTNSQAVVEKMRLEGGRVFDVHDYMSECTVEILLETAMGVSKKTQDKSGFEYAMAVMKQSSSNIEKINPVVDCKEESLVNQVSYSSPMASLVLTDSSQLTALKSYQTKLCIPTPNYMICKKHVVISCHF